MSELRKEAARRNGKLSRGPVTAEGKRRSAANSLKHGLTSKQILLPTEEPEEWNAFLAAFTERLQPADALELILIEQMAACQWKLRRAHRIEAGLLGTTIRSLSRDHRYASDESLLGHAYEKRTEMRGARALPNIERQHSVLQRDYPRAHAEFLKLRAHTPPPEDQPEPDAPTPAPEPLPETAPEPTAEPTPEPAPEPASQPCETPEQNEPKVSPQHVDDKMISRCWDRLDAALRDLGRDLPGFRYHEEYSTRDGLKQSRPQEDC